MDGSRPVAVVLALTGVVLAAIPTAVAATSDAVTDSTAAILLVAVGVLLTTSVALLLWVRPHDRRIAGLLFALAAAYAVPRIGRLRQQPRLQHLPRARAGR